MQQTVYGNSTKVIELKSLSPRGDSQSTNFLQSTVKNNVKMEYALIWNTRRDDEQLSDDCEVVYSPTKGEYLLFGKWAVHLVFDKAKFKFLKAPQAGLKRQRGMQCLRRLGKTLELVEANKSWLPILYVVIYTTLFGFSIEGPTDNHTRSPKGAKPVWAKQLYRLRCDRTCANFQDCIYSKV